MRLIGKPADFLASKGVYIFGAGEGGLIVYKALRKIRDVKILGFIDNGKRGKLCGLPVTGLDDVLDCMDSSRIVIASTYALEIASQLRKNGINDFDNALPLINAHNDRRAERRRRLKALMTVLVFFGFLIWLLA